MKPDVLTVLPTAEGFVFVPVCTGRVDGGSEFPVTFFGFQLEAGGARTAIYLVAKAGTLGSQKLLGGSGGLVTEGIFVAAVAEAEGVEVGTVDGLTEVELEVGFIDVLVIPFDVTVAGAVIIDHVHLILGGEVV